MFTKRKSFAIPSSRPLLLAAAAVGSILTSFSANGQSSFASGTEVVIPTAANISVYHTQVFVRNPNSGAMTVNVRYYQSDDGTAPAGLRACTSIDLQGRSGDEASICGTQCGLTGDNDFGMIVLEDAAPAKTNSFFAYARTQTPDGIGFSVEGFPIESFSNDQADVLGLQATAAAPNYRSNCFVASLADPVNWQMDLVQSGTELVIGVDQRITGSLSNNSNPRCLRRRSACPAISRTFARHSLPPTTPCLRSLDSARSRHRERQRRLPHGKAPDTRARRRRRRRLLARSCLRATWHGDIPSILNGLPLAFIGSTTQVTLAAPNGLAAYGGGWFRKQSSGPGTLQLGVCYQDSPTTGPGPVTLMGSTTTEAVNGTLAYKSAAGSVISVPAGTYNVGLCGQNTGSNEINKNLHTSGVRIRRFMSC